MPGVHRPAGVFIAHGPGITAQTMPPLGIADAGAMVYAFTQVAPPAFCDADWRRISNLWDQARKQPTLPQDAADPSDPYTPSQNHALLCRLADLGYL